MSNAAYPDAALVGRRVSGVARHRGRLDPGKRRCPMVRRGHAGAAWVRLDRGIAGSHRPRTTTSERRPTHRSAMLCMTSPESAPPAGVHESTAQARLHANGHAFIAAVMPTGTRKLDVLERDNAHCSPRCKVASGTARHGAIAAGSSLRSRARPKSTLALLRKSARRRRDALPWIKFMTTVLQFNGRGRAPTRRGGSRCSPSRTASRCRN